MLREVNIVNPSHVAYTGSLRSSGDESGDAWFTPPEIVQVIKKILDGIDLDPFSSEEANQTVKARRIFTLEDSAFEQKSWRAKTIFMNPPYSRGLCQKAIGRLLHEFNNKAFSAAIILVNNMTDTAWFHDLANHSQRRCDLRGRISFVTKDNKRVSGNTRGQTIFLLGCHKRVIARFDAVMPDRGLVYGPPAKGVE